MPTATSGTHEKLIEADFTELKSLPPYDGGDELIALKGQSPSQVTFATSIRTKKLGEWVSDLPANVEAALRGVADATWWLANQHKNSSNIGWPQSWIGSERNQNRSTPSQPSLLQESREQLNSTINAIPTGDIEQFDLFARKACQSPELAYLTMMALLFRQTKDKRVLAKFTEVRRKVGGYLDAIDNIIGSPE